MLDFLVTHRDLLMIVFLFLLALVAIFGQPRSPALVPIEPPAPPPDPHAKARDLYVRMRHRCGLLSPHAARGRSLEVAEGLWHVPRVSPGFSEPEAAILALQYQAAGLRRPTSMVGWIADAIGRSEGINGGYLDFNSPADRKLWIKIADCMQPNQRALAKTAIDTGSDFHRTVVSRGTPEVVEVVAFTDSDYLAVGTGKCSHPHARSAPGEEVIAAYGPEGTVLTGSESDPRPARPPKDALYRGTNMIGSQAAMDAVDVGLDAGAHRDATDTEIADMHAMAAAMQREEARRREADAALLRRGPVLED